MGASPTRRMLQPEDSMVQVKADVSRFGSKVVLWVYIDQAVRAMRRARITSAAVVGKPREVVSVDGLPGFGARCGHGSNV